MRISDWSSDVCSSDLPGRGAPRPAWRIERSAGAGGLNAYCPARRPRCRRGPAARAAPAPLAVRSGTARSGFDADAVASFFLGPVQRGGGGGHQAGTAVVRGGTIGPADAYGDPLRPPAGGQDERRWWEEG